jgi:hypothetical protein
MKLNEKPLLRFDAAETEVLKSLSAALFIGERLWVASDELNARKVNSVERLSTSDGEVFEGHRSFTLDGLVGLPAADTDKDQEIDLEGLDFDGSHLWLVGSHSRKRKKVEPDSKGEESELIKKLSEVKSKGNRFILARIPVVEEEGEQGLPSPPAGKPGKKPAEGVAQLSAEMDGNELTDAIRSPAPGGDPHLASFVDIPGKDNGLDVEGLAVAADEEAGPNVFKVFLGLRGPVLRGWAVVLELYVEAGDASRLALRKFGEGGRPYRKHFLNLDGLGVRDLARDGNDLLVLAGTPMNHDGPAAVFRWKDALGVRGETLARNEHLTRVLDIPPECDPETPPVRGIDRPEGLALVPSEGGARQVLVVYDSPGEDRRKAGPGTVRADVFDLPHA